MARSLLGRHLAHVVDDEDGAKAESTQESDKDVQVEEASA
jgi:hypothetical protein